MKLMTKELERALPALGSEENNPDPLVRVKYFHPMSHWTWYGIDYDPKERIFFGYVEGDFNELGYFSLGELEDIKVFGLGIERDLYFEPKPLSEIRAKSALAI